jgi:hypothetical protein
MKTKFDILFISNWNEDAWNLVWIFIFMRVENQNSLNDLSKIDFCNKNY